MEKEIWGNLLTISRNFYDFDRAEYERLRNGHDDWDWPDAQPLSTEKHQERFDRALNRVAEIIERKAS
jgi:hypothetical protein